MLIVIPAILRHKPVVELAIARLKNRFPDASYLIVCPVPDEFISLNDTIVRIAADDEFSLVSRAELAAALTPTKRHLVSWYYQQLLKYAVVADTQESRVLVLDSDTVVMRDIRCGPNVFFTSKERHDKYFEHFRVLFRATAPFKASAITNFMWFNTNALREMLLEIEGIHYKKWWKAIIDIINNISQDSAFSEYETYANWFALRHGPHAEVPIHIFRRGDLLIRSETDYARVISEVEGKDFEMVAFEFNHRGGLLRKLGARIFLKFSIRRW